MRSHPLKTKPPLSLLTTVLLCVGAAGCGATSNGAGSVPHASPDNTVPADSARATTASIPPHGGYLGGDGDSDNDDERHPVKGVQEYDSVAPVTYGKEASPADRRAVATLIKHYYTVAAAGDGTRACKLFTSTLAWGLGQGQSPSVGGRAKTCATVASTLFKQQRQHLEAEEVATMTVIDVRVKGDAGIATVGFRAAQWGRIDVRRERDGWRVNAVFETTPD